MSKDKGAEPTIRPRADHPISREHIDRNALKVLYRLHRAGYKAYMVGGSVRDLMVGGSPKDFDVSTDAEPHQIKKVFRNARIIGRRFRLAHVIFQNSVIEVSTFRRPPDPQAQRSPDGDLLVTSDNAYGTPRQDAFRRDFTINALFYDISDFSVIDYTGGLEDLERKIIRVIGDPDVRFQEDPVRMLRACEFAARLGFGMEDETQQGVERCREEIEKASKARITEEILQLLRCGACGSALHWMLDLGLLELLLPEAYAMLGSGAAEADYGRILSAIDRRALEGRNDSISDIALLAALLLPSVLLRREDIEAVDGRPMNRKAIEELTEELVEPFFERFVLSRLKREQTVEAIVGFQRLCEPGWTEKSRTQFGRRRFFSDALTLFELLAEGTGEGAEALEVWREVGQRVRRSRSQHQRRGRGGGRGRGNRRRPRGGRRS